MFDALDGRIARLLDSTSKFGAELDSLSDFIAFGVAPAVILYVWTMDQAGRIGWGCTLLFSACMALRLARFNTKLDNADVPAWTSRFFTGVPAPAGAGLALLPIIAYNEYGSGIADSPWLVGPWMVIVSGLLVSRIPTFSFKRLAITQRWVLPAMVIVAVFVALLVSETWNTIAGVRRALSCLHRVQPPAVSAPRDAAARTPRPSTSAPSRIWICIEDLTAAPRCWIAPRGG